jgi:pimeloyl-ACP methyl ester carboxylesterase
MARVRTNGCELHYEVTGAGPPVLLVHGLGSCGADWSLQVPALAERYTVITVDLRGHGESDKPPGPYTMPMLAADVAGLLEALGLGPAHVVGLSLGGMLAFQLVVDAPRLVRTLAIINSGPSFVLRNARMRLAIEARFWAIRLLGIRWLGKKIAAVNFPDPGQEAMRDALAARIAANDVRAYKATMRAFVGWSVLDRVPAITCPALIVAAENDYTPVSLKRVYAEKMQHARVEVVPRSRHVTPTDQPEALNRLLLAFLDEQAK